MLCILAADAHMIMTSPEPYSRNTLNNSPLAADGSDFPCKLRADAFIAPSVETVIEVGGSHELTFQGSATHGGGSCQISLTTDREPTKDSQWKVIKSFEGGCPANDDGNLSGGPSEIDPFTFHFEIPTGISAGNYTLAWTWFNRRGRREIYMNCAPITVIEAPAKRTTPRVRGRSPKFPTMFVANINGCTTSEGVDIRFPQPGDFVEFDGEATTLAATDQPACTGSPSFGSTT